MKRNRNGTRLWLPAAFLILAIVAIAIFATNGRAAPWESQDLPPAQSQPDSVAQQATLPPQIPATPAPAAATATAAPAVEPAAGQPAGAGSVTAKATAASAPPAAAAATSGALATIDSLDALTLGRRDQVQLALEFGRTTSTERVARKEPLPDKVGTQTVFWVSNIAEHTHYTTTATLHIALDRVLMYVENGVEFDRAALERSARDFNDNIYPRDRELFGEEWSPGIDGDPRITILNARIPGVGGYFSGSDEVPRSVNRFSNEREMFYMNIDDRPLGSRTYSSVLAHEFQHMIQWNQSKEDATWINEGLSQLAEELNRYSDDGMGGTFLAAPDVQLTDWADLVDERMEAIAHYDASYLFLSYFYERYQKAANLKELVREGAGENLEVIARQARKVRPQLASFDDLFADWAVANLLNDRRLEQGRWSYRRLPLTVRPEVRADGRVSGTVTQHGADYVELPAARAARTFAFDGSDLIGLVPARPEGNVSWWSNRGDDAVSTLTGRFDLRALKTATLRFRLWFDIEKDYDYGFVSVSTDDGKTWKTLPGKHTTTEDPQGANYGHGFTGVSGTREPGWVDESIDLTPFAGRSVLIRFSLISDDALNETGMLVDNIRIPELGFVDDAERDTGAWQAAGWVRTDNRLPQRWELRLVRYSPQAPTRASKVEAVELDAQGRATIRLARGERGVLVVMATTPHTTERASYTINPGAAAVSGSGWPAGAER